MLWFTAAQGRWKTPYTNLFYSALGLASFFDVTWTSAVEPGNPYKLARLNVELQYLLAALGNGALGIGDGPGMTNRTLLMQAMQADGLLRKALHPLTPIDAMFGDASAGVPAGAQVFSTVSSFAIDTGARTDPGVTDWQWWHIVAVNVTREFLLGPDDLSPPLTPHIAYVAYNYFDSAGCAHGAPAAGCVTPFGHGHHRFTLARLRRAQMSSVSACGVSLRSASALGRVSIHRAGSLCWESGRNTSLSRPSA